MTRSPDTGGNFFSLLFFAVSEGILLAARMKPKAVTILLMSPGISSIWLCHSSLYRSRWSSGSTAIADRIIHLVKESIQALHSSESSLYRVAPKTPRIQSATAPRIIQIGSTRIRALQLRSSFFVQPLLLGSPQDG